MFYGILKPRIVSDATDRVGKRTLSLIQAWKPSQPGLTLEEIADERPATPKSDLWCIGIQTSSRGGYMETQWTFEGSTGGDGVHSTREWSFKAVWAEVPLTAHPMLQDLLDTYGGVYNPDTDKIDWPKEIAPAVKDSGGFSQSSTNDITANPMFGRQTYWDLTGGIYTYKHFESALPTGLFDNVGLPLEPNELPGVPPWIRRRNWLKVMPEYWQRGSGVEITEPYWLSDMKGKWPNQIYIGNNF